MFDEDRRHGGNRGMGDWEVEVALGWHTYHFYLMIFSCWWVGEKEKRKSVVRIFRRQEIWSYSKIEYSSFCLYSKCGVI